MGGLRMLEILLVDNLDMNQVKGMHGLTFMVSWTSFWPTLLLTTICIIACTALWHALKLLSIYRLLVELSQGMSSICFVSMSVVYLRLCTPCHLLPLSLSLPHMQFLHIKQFLLHQSMVSYSIGSTVLAQRPLYSNAHIISP